MLVTIEGNAKAQRWLDTAWQRLPKHQRSNSRTCIILIFNVRARGQWRVLQGVDAGTRLEEEDIDLVTDPVDPVRGRKSVRRWTDM
jgi:hypothetical protein